MKVLSTIGALAWGALCVGTASGIFTANNIDYCVASGLLCLVCLCFALGGG